MDVLQVLYSLWTSNRELTSKDADERERQAFDAGFKTAMQLCRQDINLLNKIEKYSNHIW